MGVCIKGGLTGHTDREIRERQGFSGSGFSRRQPDVNQGDSQLSDISGAAIFFYTAFGLRIRSSARISRLPVAVEARCGSASEVVLEFTSVWTGRRPNSGEALLHSFPNPADPLSPLLEIWKRHSKNDYRLLFDSRVEFTLRQSGRHITVGRKAAATMDDVVAYLLGPVMGAVLRLQGFVCLHASAVVIDGRAIALMAPPGHGKSTLAAAFAKMGHPVLTDDILAIRKGKKRIEVQPAYPQIRLRPEAVKSLFGRCDALPRLSPKNPKLEKHILDLAASDLRFADKPAELSAIYTGRENKHAASTHIKSLRGIPRFLTICGNTYLTPVMDEQTHRIHFEVLDRITETVPVRSIETPNRNAMTPFELCDHILDDLSRT